MTKPILSQEYVCALFEYRDGDLFWKERPRSEFKTDLKYKQWNPKHAGKKAGYYSGVYTFVRINRHLYRMHRIIFLMHHGYMPQVIDHADGNPSNSRIENLREATQAKNIYNQRLSSRNTSGYKGIRKLKTSNKWSVRIGFKKKEIFIGNFTNLQDAVDAARKAREKYHGEFARLQ